MTSFYDDATPLQLTTDERTSGEVTAFVRTANGHRPKCLFIHGNPGCLLDWEALVPSITAWSDVALIDLPGFGKSPRRDAAPDSVNLEGLAACVLATMDALGWSEPIFVVGHSHGGGVAQMVAARYPERVAGLVLIASLAGKAHPSYRALSLPGMTAFMQVVGRLFRTERLAPLNRVILRQIMADICSPEVVPAPLLERELAAFAARPEILETMVHVSLGRPCTQLWAAAPQIRCPTLFIHGSKDRLVPASYVRALHERIVNAGGRSHFELVSGAGHLLIAYQAQDVADLVRRHVETNSSSATSASP